MGLEMKDQKNNEGFQKKFLKGLKSLWEGIFNCLAFCHFEDNGPVCPLKLLYWWRNESQHLIFRGKEQGEICQGWLSNITCMVDFEKHRKKSVELMGVVVVGMLACGFHMSFPFNSVDRKWQTSFSPMGTTMKSYWIYYCVPKKMEMICLVRSFLDFLMTVKKSASSVSRQSCTWYVIGQALIGHHRCFLIVFFVTFNRLSDS